MRPRPLPPRPGDVDPELRFHVEMQVRRFVAEGLTEDEARRRAMERLGDLGTVRAACRAIGEAGDTTMRRSLSPAAFRHHLRDGWRGLRRSPVFTLTAVATLAIGIGATTAMFSVFNAVLLDSLPYRHADRVLVVWNTYGAGMPEAAVSAAEFADLLESPGRFDQVAAVQPQQVALAGSCGSGDSACDPERIDAYAVSPNLFDLAGVAPRLGRPFTAADGSETSETVVMLSDALWRRRYNADEAIVGRPVTIGGTPAVVVGVMPPGVRFPDEPIGFLRARADLWIAYRWERNREDSRGNQNLAVIARLEEGSSRADGDATLARLSDRFRQAFPGRYVRDGMTWGLISVPFRDAMVGDVRTALVVLFVAVGLVLLIACANVASLLMTRGATRARDLAVRAALGAGRGRLVMQLLTESGLLAAAGAVFGILLGLAGIAALQRLDPGSIPRLDTVSLDGRVLAFTIAITTLATFVVGLLPALRHSRIGPEHALGEAGMRGAGRSAVGHGLRRALVIGEVALAVVVLVGAGLVARSLTALRSVPTGVNPSGVVAFQVSPPRAQYLAGEPVMALHQGILDQLSVLPGVIHVGTASPLPLSGERWSGTFNIDGRPVPDGQQDPHAEFSAVSPGYFDAVGLRLVEGRDFTPADRRGASSVVVIDQALARMYWPGESAIGKRIDTDGRLDPNVATVVGVVEHVRNGGPRDDGEPQIYLSEWQFPARTVDFVVRSADPALTMSGVRAAVSAVDPQLPAARLGLMSDLEDQVFARDRFNATVLGVFAGVALLLAVIGLYGVLGYLVTERSREIGIRLALGGRPASVARRVVGEGLGLTIVGVLVGLGASAVLAGGLEGLLFGVPPTDPATYAAIAALLIVTAGVACVVPVRRAVSVDPLRVLRE